MKKTLYLFTLIILASITHAQIALTAQDSIRLWPDSIHAPFIFGVTSGDPTDSSVIIWSAIPYDSTRSTHQLDWDLATDSTFGTILQTGSVQINDVTAYAAKVDVQGLRPFTRYCYRFSENFHYSVTGYTQTAPDSTSTVDSLSFALVSCSSLYSGYFNSYRQIANNPGINAIIHVGDWIYDFIDPQERVRLPQPEPVEPVSLAEWRDRYRLYLLDPDLREARRRKPWIQMWDNHDVTKDNDSTIRICSRAYWEFGPCRRPSADSLQIWRKVAYGTLADIIIVDDWIYQGRDTFADGSKRMIPEDQYQWLIDQLDSSRAIWKFVPVSKLFSQWELGAAAALLPGSGLSHEWEGYPECRDSVLVHLMADHINNTVIGSGDLHINIASDLSINPFDSTIYNGLTGSGGLGVELNGISISRGNFDESGIGTDLGPSLYATSFGKNPHQRYLNFYDNGYAILTVNRDSMIARMMLCPILSVTDSQRVDVVLYDRVNDNHWLRLDTPALSVKNVAAYRPVAAFPNPSITGDWTINADASLIGAPIEISTAEGQLVYRSTISDTETPLHTGLPTGIYFLRVSSSSGSYVVKLVRLGS